MVIPRYVNKKRVSALIIPVYFFKPLVNAWHMIFMVAGKDSDLISILIFGKADITSSEMHNRKFDIVK